MAALAPRELARAVWRGLRRLESARLHYLEDCVSCGICHNICPFNRVSHEYAPANAAEWMRRFYRRYATISGVLLRRAAHAYTITWERALKARGYAYRCTNCGRCYLYCAFGIDSGALVEMLRDVVDAAGATPPPIKALERCEAEGAYLKAKQVKEMWDKLLDEVKKVIGRDPPIDRPGTYLLMTSVSDVLFLKDAIMGIIRVLETAGIPWCLPSRPLGIMPPIAYCSGNLSVTARVLEEMISYAEKLGPSRVIVIDCGYPYYVLRFEAPYILGREVRIKKILSSVELLDELIAKRFVYVRRTGERVVYHDPCFLARRSGVYSEPRHVLKDVVELVEVKPYGKDVFCCGGGFGNVLLYRDVYEPLAKAVEVEVKLSREDEEFIGKVTADIDWVLRIRCRSFLRKGVTHIITACTSCIKMFERGIKLVGIPGGTVEHIAAYVGKNVIERKYVMPSHVV